MPSVNDGYVLGRDASENERLRGQNEILVKALGFTLHPLILSRLGTSLCITELASGPGTFLIGLSSTLSPDSKIEGTDISPEAWEANDAGFPANVKMRVVDAKSPVEEARRGGCDVVCVRFMNVANREDDWGLVAAHAYGLLREGGALQWIEGDFLQCNPALQLHPGAPTTACDRLYNAAFVNNPHWRYFITHLAPILSQTGFSSVHREVIGTDRVPELRDGINWMGVGAQMSMLRFMAKKGVPGALGEEEMERLRREAVEELEGGVYLRFDMHVFVAFK